MDCDSLWLSIRSAYQEMTYGEYLNYKNPHVKNTKIPESTCKINSGVLVFDVGRWKRWNITDELMYWTELNTRY